MAHFLKLYRGECVMGKTKHNKYFYRISCTGRPIVGERGQESDREEFQKIMWYCFNSHLHLKESPVQSHVFWGRQKRHNSKWFLAKGDRWIKRSSLYLATNRCNEKWIQMPCWQKVAAGPFWQCFACPKLGDAGRTRVARKNRAVLRKAQQSQFLL